MKNFLQKKYHEKQSFSQVTSRTSKKMDNFGWLQTEGQPSNVTQWNEMTNFNPRQNYLPGFEGLEKVEKVFLESNLEAGAGCNF